MSTLNRPGAYFYNDPFTVGNTSFPSIPTFTADTTPSAAAALITSYLSQVAQLSIQSSFTTGNTLDTSPAKGAQTAANILADVYGTKADILAPIVLMPNAPDISLLNVDFDAALTEVRGVVDSLQTSWLTKYFPASLNDGLDNLLQTVTNGTIVSTNIQEIMWSRARDQTARDAARYQDEAISAWASRGFSLPGGSLDKKLQRSNQDLFFASADLAAQQAIKALDIQVDTVKFAADVGTRLRLGLIEGLTGLVNAYSRLPSAAAEYAAAAAEAKRAAYEAVAAYYRTVIEASDLQFRSSSANATLNAQNLSTAASFMGAYMSSQVSAVAAATDAYALTAGNAVQALNNLTSSNIRIETASV